MKNSIILICCFFLQVIGYSQFPLAVGNRWDFGEGYWNGSGDFDEDTTIYKITSDTVMLNGYTYFRISPVSLFKDFVRADSVGIYYYDPVNNKEWLFYEYDINDGSNGYPNSEHISAGYLMNNSDTSNFIKFYKWGDGKQLIFGDSVRVITYFVDLGLDNSYFISISPQYGFISTHQSDWIYNYNSFIIGCVLSGKIYGILTSIMSEQSRPITATLNQNYPNPFNPTTTISYSVRKRSHVLIKIFDILSRQVAELVNEEESAGSYKIKFDGSKLSSGIYFYTLQYNEFSQTKKMVLLK